MRRVDQLRIAAGNVLGPGLLLGLLLAGSRVSLRAGNWPQWRGPAGDSVSQESNLPTHWLEKENVAWKAALPEWGTSTPVLNDNAIFVTTELDSENDGALLLLKLDKSKGQIVWKERVGTGRANRKERGSKSRTSKYHNLHNMASPSPVSDGQRVIVHFGNGDLASYTFDGRQEWKRNLASDYGHYTIWWGHANSPIIVGDAVISVCMQDSLEGVSKELSPSYIVAHDKRTGKELWKTMRMTHADAEQCDSYTTPILATVSGRTEMIVMGGNEVDAYDPATGKRLWELPGLKGNRTITGPTVADNFLYVTVGMRGPLNAVKLGGDPPHDIASAVAWKYADATPDTPCPVVAGGQVFLVSDSGIATCLDAKSGKRNWRERLASRNVKSSPLAADGHIYFLGHDGQCTVIDASGTFKIVAQNRLDDEFTASPAVSDGRIYLRGRKALYAIGK
jgi:outer membrane protein assembly factor BamB